MSDPSHRMERSQWHQRAYKRGVHHPPLRTLAEMAEEFGVTPKSLGGLLRAPQWSPPSPKFNHHSIATGTAKYFDPTEMRAWWARRNPLTPQTC